LDRRRKVNCRMSLADFALPATLISKTQPLSPMTATQRRQQFESLVTMAERQMAENATLYQAKIALLALLGYLVLFGMVAVLCGLAVGMIVLAVKGHAWWILVKAKLLIGVGLIAYIILKALWVRLEEPVGYEITPERCPQLFAEVNRLRKELQTPAIHRILITNELNAAIAQTPRLGVLGWYRNTLIMGLQLLLVSSPEQARAVLAHELGHLSGNHSRFRGWIYRVRLAWYRVMEAFDQAENWAAKFVGKFFDWYAPYFNAYSFALARANEYEADAIAARLTSPRIVASSLINLEVQSHLLDTHYWTPLIQKADSEPTPPDNPVTQFAHFVAEHHPEAPTWHTITEKALAAQTGHSDTHPALQDRVKALHAKVLDPEPLKMTAAHKWLGKQLPIILSDFDKQWLDANQAAWSERAETVAQSKATLETLKQQPYENLSQDDGWALASLSEQYAPDTDPLPYYRLYHERFPDDLAADLAIGRILTERNDPTGLAHLEKATNHFNLHLAACEIAYAYAHRQGDTESAERWRLRGERQLDREAAARAERASVEKTDEFIPASLDPEALQALRKQLESVPKVKQAWICRKNLQYVPTDPLYVLVVTHTGILWDQDELLNQLTNDITFPGAAFVIIKTGGNRSLANRAIQSGTPILS
jgi:Zn-dependent protease with chaperone function